VKQPRRLRHRLIEGQMLQAVEWVVMDEVAHRPEERQHLTGHGDHAANLEPFAEGQTMLPRRIGMPLRA
jgi:hypothetical protein